MSILDEPFVDDEYDWEVLLLLLLWGTWKVMLPQWRMAVTRRKMEEMVDGAKPMVA